MTMSIFGHLSVPTKPSRVRYLASIGPDDKTDALFFTTVNGQQQLTPNAKIEAVGLMDQSDFVQSPDGKGGYLLTLNGLPVQVGGLTAKQRIDSRAPVTDTVIISILPLEQAVQGDLTAISKIVLQITSDPATIAALTAPGQGYAILDPLKPTQSVNTASSSGGSGGAIFAIGAVLAALALAVSSGKKNAPSHMANPTRAYNAHFEHARGAHRYAANPTCSYCSAS